MGPTGGPMPPTGGPMPPTGGPMPPTSLAPVPADGSAPIETPATAL